MLFDDLFREIGEFGRYQIFLYCLLGLVGIPTGWQNMAITFIGADVASWCHIDALQNLTDEQQRFVAMTYDKDGEYSRCLQFDWDFSNYTQKQLNNWTRSTIPKDTATKMCEKFVYDTSVFESTVGSQWELVCEKQSLISLIQTIYMAGFLTGCLVFGQLSDTIGRHRALLIGLVLEVIFALGATFCPIYELYCVLRFFVGVSAAGAFTTTFVLTMEIIGPKYRMGAGIFVQGWFAGGLITYPFMSYFVRNHIHLQLLASCLTILLWGLYFVIPESPRWHVTHGNDKEAEDIMRLLARRNGRPCPEVLNLAENRQHDDAGKNTASIIDLWRRPKIRKVTALMWFCWFVASLSYYGLSLGVDFLEGSLFFNSCLSGLVEIPAYIIIIAIMDRTGRKWPTIITFLLGALFCIACMPLFAYPDLNTLLTTFLMTGKCAVAGCFAIAYVYAAELFPTVVRNVGVGSSSMCARLSALLQPQVALMRNIWVPLPFLVYGATSLIAGLAAFFLPETLGKRLPETLEDVENEPQKNGLQMKEKLPEVTISATHRKPTQESIRF